MRSILRVWFPSLVLAVFALGCSSNNSDKDSSRGKPIKDKGGAVILGGEDDPERAKDEQPKDEQPKSKRVKPVPPPPTINPP